MAFWRGSVWITSTVWLSLPATFAWAPDSEKGSEADTVAIKQVFSEFYQSFSRQDARATAMT